MWAAKEAEGGVIKIPWILLECHVLHYFPTICVCVGGGEQKFHHEWPESPAVLQAIIKYTVKFVPSYFFTFIHHRQLQGMREGKILRPQQWFSDQGVVLIMLPSLVHKWRRAYWCYQMHLNKACSREALGADSPSCLSAAEACFLSFPWECMLLIAVWVNLPQQTGADSLWGKVEIRILCVRRKGWGGNVATQG